MVIRRSIGGLTLLAAIALLALTQTPLAHHAVAQSTLTQRAYLPIVYQPISAAITFGTSADANGIPSPPTNDIPPSARLLYYNARIVGAAGRPFRLVLLLNGDPLFDPSDDDVGTLASNVENVNNSICFTRQEDTDCSSPTSTLRPGTYTLQVFVDNVLINQASATVRASLNSSETDGAAQVQRGR